MMANVFVNREESSLSLEGVKSIYLCAEEAAGIHEKATTGTKTWGCIQGRLKLTQRIQGR